MQVEFGERKMDKFIKNAFIIRVVMWIIALAATIYWIYWSFHIYEIGVMDEHEYALIFRPIFAKSLIVSLIAIGVSFRLRIMSDRIKDKKKTAIS